MNMIASFFIFVQGSLFPGMFNILILPFLGLFMLGGYSSFTGSSQALSESAPPVPPSAALESNASILSYTEDSEIIAKCLADKGVRFYGAYWCPHCSDQKKAFGDAVKYLPYTECDAKGKNADPQACKDADIKGYPTWVFPDGQRLEGEQSPEDLASKAGCSDNAT